MNQKSKISSNKKNLKKKSKTVIPLYQDLFGEVDRQMIQNILRQQLHKLNLLKIYKDEIIDIDVKIGT